MTPRELTNEIVKILDKKKALDITAIKTEELTIVSDYFVIATGTSNTHVKSLADDLEYEMDKLGAAPVHLFQKDQREYYNLERLWNDAQQLDISDLLTD